MVRRGAAFYGIAMSARPTCRVATALLIASAALPLAAQPIYKCVDQDGTAYQSTPCAPGAAQKQLPNPVPPVANESDVLAPLTPAGSTAERSAVVSPPIVPERRPGEKLGPWTHTTLVLGASDDEVLNLRGFGRPNRISRSKAVRGWREEWTYDRSFGEERLYFANGRLVDIVRPGTIRIAEVSPR